MKKIDLLKASEDGSVHALSATHATLALLKVLSIIYKVNLVELNAKVYFEDGAFYLSYRFNGDDSQLIEADWLEILEQKLHAISHGIHKKPNAPRLGVFHEVGITAAEHDSIIKEINNHRPLFNSLGFCQQRGERKIQLKPVSDLIAKKTKVKEFMGCIAAVCNHAAQPYVTFFYYNAKNELQQYNETISRIEANLTYEEALKLDDIRISERGKTEQTILNIKVRETEGVGRKYELLSYDFPSQNRELDLN
jgi:hypothetical protein